jgi:hypothetical protein
MWMLIGLQILAVVLFLSGSFLFLIPKAVISYQVWEKKQEPMQLSAALIIFGLAAAMALSVYVFYLKVLLRFDFFGLPAWGQLGLTLVLLYLIAAVLIPRAVWAFQKWKTSGKPLDWSLMCFFSFLALFAFSVVCLKFLGAVVQGHFSAPEVFKRFQTLGGPILRKL